MKWFNAFIGQLDEMIGAISQNALQVATASEELNVTSQQITANSEQTSAQAPSGEAGVVLQLVSTRRLSQRQAWLWA